MKKIKITSLLLILVMLSVLFSGCGDEAPYSIPTGLVSGIPRFRQDVRQRA